MSRQPNRYKAFTLIELMLVMVIISVLAAIVVPTYTNRVRHARNVAAKQGISSLSTALNTFEIDNGRYPTNDEGLAALSEPPPSLMASWHGPYVDKQIIIDPWQRPYVYRFPGTRNPRGFELLSLGEDGQEGSADDIDNWTNTN